MTKQQHFDCALYWLARKIYVDTTSLARECIFSETDIYEFSVRVYALAHKKWTVIGSARTFVEAAAALYNHEIIVDAEIWSRVTILDWLLQMRRYKIKKFKKIIVNKDYHKLIYKGVLYKEIKEIFNELEETINVIDS